MTYHAAQPTIERLVRLAVRLGAGQRVTTAYIQGAFGVSLATAKRDMVRLEGMLPVLVEDGPNTHPKGGGVPPKALRLMAGSQLFPIVRALNEASV